LVIATHHHEQSGTQHCELVRETRHNSCLHTCEIFNAIDLRLQTSTSCDLTMVRKVS
jgi:hypothetical protein